MRQKLLKIALLGAVGFVVPYAVSSAVTRFSLVVLSAFAERRSRAAEVASPKR